MSDWSEPYLQAQKAMKKAENSLALKRIAEGNYWVQTARDELEKVSLLLSATRVQP